MLFEALAGRPPFSASDANALREMHCYSPAPRAKSVNAAMPDLLDGVIKKLLSKEQRDRYQSAGEVQNALRSVVLTGDTDIHALAARMRAHHDAEEADRLARQREAKSEDDANAKKKYKEQEVIEMIDDVVAGINAHLAETKIVAQRTLTGKEYRFGNRTLRVHFWRPGEILVNPLVPGRLETLRQRAVVHGGLIEIHESQADREGWNLVLLRPQSSAYGEWRIVETRVSAVARYGTQYEPIATDAQLFADNLACHWLPAMHVFNLTDKPLDRGGIVRILGVFIPKL
jgi:hypothetical protein